MARAPKEESEPDEVPGVDSSNKPLLMVANKPKGLPKRAPGPGGIGGIAATAKSGNVSNLISKCLEKKVVPLPK